MNGSVALVRLLRRNSTTEPCHLIGTRFGGGLYQRTGGGAELRVVVTGGYFEILQRIDIRIDNGNAENRALIFGAVEEKTVCCREELPVDIHLNAPFTIAAIWQALVQLDPGNNKKEIRHVAIEHGKLLDLSPGQTGGDFRPVRSKQRRGIRHLHACLHVGRRQFHIERRGSVDLDCRVGGKHAESCAGHSDLIVPGEQVGLRKLPTTAALQMVNSAPVEIRNRNCRVRDCSACWSSWTVPEMLPETAWPKAAEEIKEQKKHERDVKT